MSTSSGVNVYVFMSILNCNHVLFFLEVAEKTFGYCWVFLLFFV